MGTKPCVISLPSPSPSQWPPSPSPTGLQLHWHPSYSLTIVGRFDHVAQAVHSVWMPFPRYLQGSPPTSLKTVSKATFWTGLTVATLFNTQTSHPAHSHTPDALSTTCLFFLFINWHLSLSTILLNLLHYYVPCLLYVSSTKTWIFVLFPDLPQALWKESGV